MNYNQIVNMLESHIDTMLSGLSNSSLVNIYRELYRDDATTAEMRKRLKHSLAHSVAERGVIKGREHA